MGLSMVHGLMHELGGHVLVETAPGQGTNFRVLFPLPEQSVGRTEPDNATDAGSHRAPTFTGRVLVVDDDEAAAGFMGDLLETWGIEATVLRDSPAALELFRHDPRAFDLAILDQTMPQMKGLELARHFHDLDPDFPVILYSGYSEGITPEAMEAAGVSVRVHKPVDTDELRALMRDLLPASP
jgi:CheY-like chemotaxis protein